jgi:hypothetical protein
MIINQSANPSINQSINQSNCGSGKNLLWRNGISSLITQLMTIALVVMLPFAAWSTPMSLSPNLQVVMVAKILMYEKNYKKSGAISVYVINAPKVSEAFIKLIGETSGHIDIKSVASGNTLPKKRYDLIYFNDIEFVAQAKAYANKYRAVLVTGKKLLVEKGVTLGTSAEQGRPQFYLNLTSSFSADLDWEPKILAIVGTFR